MKTLLVDYTHEKDKHFNDPLREKIGDHEVWKPQDINSSAALRGFSAIVIGGVPDNIPRYPFSLTRQDVSPILKSGIPSLGVCLGHQLLGQNLDAELMINEEREKGVVTIKKSLEVNDELLKGLPEEFDVVTMHYGSVTVPTNSTLLATSETCLNQAMVDETGLIYSTQFHPERSEEVGDAIFYNLARIASNHMQSQNAA